MSARTDAIVEWLREQISQSGASGFVVGLSGGIDSAVVARLCQEAAPTSVVGLIMPCHSDPQDEADARLVADHFGIPIARVDLAPVHDVLIEDLRYLAEHLMQGQRGREDSSARAPMANVKPRLRMTTLYFLANTLSYLVAGTGNRSELATGCFTKYGDGGADVLPIGHLLKSEVRDVAREIGVPDAIVAKVSSAGLWRGQTDEEDMGFSYDQLEAYLTKGPQRVAPAVVMRIERLIRRSEHKRAVPPAPEKP